MTAQDRGRPVPTPHGETGAHGLSGPPSLNAGEAESETAPPSIPEPVASTPPLVDASTSPAELSTLGEIALMAREIHDEAALGLRLLDVSDVFFSGTYLRTAVPPLELLAHLAILVADLATHLEQT